MNVGIVGLGLIGGSLAKAYKQAGATVLGYDKDGVITGFAKMADAIDDELDESHFSSCDVIFIAITPDATIEWFRNNAPKLSKETIIIDCGGTKRKICKNCFEIADKHGLTFLGGHPMAGKERGGFKYSSADLFDDAPFMLVPKDHNDIELLCKVKRIILKGGFSRIAVCNAEEHDRVIAFTSQMPHIVSNGFIKSKTAFDSMDKSKMISAGSYKDFTRVAYMDEKMWTELFMENSDNLKIELHTLIEELLKYEEALEQNDSDRMIRLLAEGKKCRSEV